MPLLGTLALIVAAARPGRRARLARDLAARLGRRAPGHVRGAAGRLRAASRATGASGGCAYAAQRPGPRDRPHRPPRGRLGAGAGAARGRRAGRGGLRPALRRRALPVVGGREARRAAGDLSSPTARTPRTSGPGCATAPGRIRTTRPTAAARRSSRRSSRSAPGATGRDDGAARAPSGSRARWTRRAARRSSRRAAGATPTPGPAPPARARSTAATRPASATARETAMAIGAPLVAALTVLALRRRRSSRDAEHREP